MKTTLFLRNQDKSSKNSYKPIPTSKSSESFTSLIYCLLFMFYF